MSETAGGFSLPPSVSLIRRATRKSGIHTILLRRELRSGFCGPPRGLRWGTAAWGMGQNMVALRTWHCYCFPATTTHMYSPPVARSPRMYRTSSLCHTFAVRGAGVGISTAGAQDLNEVQFWVQCALWRPSTWYFKSGLLPYFGPRNAGASVYSRIHVCIRFCNELPTR